MPIQENINPQSIFLKAGAGAGKTTRLVATFINFCDEFYKKQKRYPNVIITTFTKKATQELKERLLKKTIEDKKSELQAVLSNQSQIHISTIHGVLTLFLSQFAQNLSLNPKFKIISANDLFILQKKVLRQILTTNEEYIELLEEFSFEELLSICELHYENFFSYPDIQFLTVDDLKKHAHEKWNQFQAEAKDLVKLIADNSPGEKWDEFSKNLHAFVLQKGIPSQEQLVSFADSVEFPRKSKKTPEVLAEFTSSFKAEIFNYVTGDKTRHFFDENFWMRFEKKHSLCAKVFLQYINSIEEQKRIIASISMSDLELYSLKLIRQFPETAKSFSLQWDYWMIDEFQDTSPRQVELLNSLVSQSPQFIVGDPQQSIYFFRGARAEVFLDKQQEFIDQKIHTEKLITNFRSTGGVLGFINFCFKDKKDFESMLVGKKSDEVFEDSDVYLRPLKQTDQIQSDLCSAAIVQDVFDLISKNIPPEKICILAKKNADLNKVQETLELYGIPHQVHTAGSYVQRQELIDVLSFLRFLANPHDNLNFLTLLRTPWFKISDQDLVHLSVDSSYWLTAKMKFSSSEVIQALLGYLNFESKNGVALTLRKFYKERGLIDSAKSLDPSERREANLWKLCSLLENACKQKNFQLNRFVSDFVSGSKKDDESDAVPSIEPNRVQLMTIHASKGLEFDYVFVTHMHGWRNYEIENLYMFSEEQKKWSVVEKIAHEVRRGTYLSLQVNQNKNERLKEESLRLLYVALTRAKKQLRLYWENGRAAKDSRSWISQLNLPSQLIENEGSQEIENFKLVVDSNVSENFKKVVNSALKAQDLKSKFVSFNSEAMYTIGVTQLLNNRNKETIEGRADRSIAVLQGLERAQKGTEIHAYFEALKYHKSLLPQQDEILEGFEWLRNEKYFPYLEILNSGFVEFGMSFQVGNYIVQGQIDLWGEAQDEIWVVDYKSGSTKYYETAFQQLEIYAFGLMQAKLVKSDKINLAVIYPLEKILKVRKLEVEMLKKKVQEVIYNNP